MCPVIPFRCVFSAIPLSGPANAIHQGWLIQLGDFWHVATSYMGFGYVFRCMRSGNGADRRSRYVVKADRGGTNP